MRARLRRLAWRILGAPIWRPIVVGALRLHYRSRFKHAWSSDHPPHFTDFGWVASEFAFGAHTSYGFSRAFYTAELLRYGDRLLDIGCGDGFADRHFYSEKCASIDAIDIEPTAIFAARRENAAPNITYHLADAVATPFPIPPYDVIVWDGAIGHFAPGTTRSMLVKIRDALAPDGVFTGSESLGSEEGEYDHLRFFETLDDLAGMLREVFPLVRVREMTYTVPGGLRRREGYWRCANDVSRLDSGWSSPS